MNSIFKTSRSLLLKKTMIFAIYTCYKNKFYNLDTFDVKQNYGIFKKNLRKIN